MPYFVRNQDIIGNLYIPNKEQNNRIGLVWLPGLPNHPIVEDMGQPLADLGFTVLNTRYPGSWQSYGSFGPSTSLDGALLGLDLLSKGETQDLASQQQISWDIDHLVLVGNSYGGAITISALAKSDLADAAIAFCPLLEPASQNEDPALPESDLTSIYPFLKRCHENVFRDLDFEEWENFMKGDHRSNPNQYIDDIKDKPVLFLHGLEDTSIRSYHTERFHQKLKKAGSQKAEGVYKEGIGHGRPLRLATRDLWVDWLMKSLSES